VTQLRKKLLEELQCRNYSHRTAKTYVRIIREFAEYFHQGFNANLPRAAALHCHPLGGKTVKRRREDEKKRLSA
jgi:integrase-like protein